MAQLLRALSNRNSRFGTQYLSGGSQLSVTHVPGDQIPLMASVNCTHMVHITLVGKISYIYSFINF